MSLSDLSHLDTCASRFCNTLDLRSNMHRVEGKRGYFCGPCFARFQPKILTQDDGFYLYGDVSHPGTFELQESFEEFPQ